MPVTADKLTINPECEQDILDAYSWYEDQRVGLGEDFLTCLDALFETIRRSPQSNAMVYQSFRRGLVRRFPYVVFYELGAGEVFVYGVFHAARNPAKWKKRLK